MPRRRLPVLALPVALLAIAGPADGRPAADRADPGVAPSADGSVARATPARRLARARTLVAGPAARRRAHLTFTAPRGAGDVVSTHLRLVAVRGRGLVEVRRASPGRWTERTLSWRTAPRVGAVLARGTLRGGRARTFALPASAGAGSRLHLVLVVRGRGTVRIASREDARRAPRLIVRRSGAGTPPASSAPAPGPTPAPGAPVVTLTAPAPGAESDGRPAFAGRAEVGGGSVTVRVTVAGGTEQVLTAPVGADGAWSTRAPLLQPGSHSAVATQTASGGRTGTSARVSFTVATTVAAAGDIACSPSSPHYNGGAGSADRCRQRDTSDLLLDRGYHSVLALGDNQYENGTLDEFRASYDPTWGRAKGITSPVAGNHEYATPGAAGYFDYFNGVGQPSGRAGDRAKGYYSFDVGSTHFIALNSNCRALPRGTGAHGCDAGSPQEAFVRADLAASDHACTVAFWHHPRFTSDDYRYEGVRTVTDATDMDVIFRALQAGGVELALNGHAHLYERFAPVRYDAAAGKYVADEARGLREITVGVGGEEFHPIGAPHAHSQVRNGDTFGVLRLKLGTSALSWAFVRAAGPNGTFGDSGTQACH